MTRPRALCRPGQAGGYESAQRNYHKRAHPVSHARKPTTDGSVVNAFFGGRNHDVPVHFVSWATVQRRACGLLPFALIEAEARRTFPASRRRATPAEPPKATVLGVDHAGRFHPPAIGGSERIALLALEQLASRGFRVLLACPGETELARAATRRGIPVRPLKFLAMRGSRSVRTLAEYAHSVAALGYELRRLCREERIDVVHAFSLTSALYALAGTVGARRPLVVHIQDAQPPRPLRHAALRIISRNGIRLICVSLAVKEMLREVGVPAEKLALIYNGVEQRFFEPDHERPSNVSGPGPHIGLFSHIIPWKGHHVFLDAAALVARRFPSARFYVVGATIADVPASYVESLHARAHEPPLAGRICFTGPILDVAPWMAAMDVVVHSSVAPEAFGLVIAEGMALGKSVVVADCGAPRELVVHGETGYLAQAGDAQDLARTLEHVLERDDPYVRHRAAAVARARFTPALFGVELEHLYDDVLRASRRNGD
jgi:glycosyltransferase involved in cell wall biosynthesis